MKQSDLRSAIRETVWSSLAKCQGKYPAGAAMKIQAADLRVVTESLVCVVIATDNDCGRKSKNQEDLETP